MPLKSPPVIPFFNLCVFYQFISFVIVNPTYMGVYFSQMAVILNAVHQTEVEFIGEFLPKVTSSTEYKLCVLLPCVRLVPILYV